MTPDDYTALADRLAEAMELDLTIEWQDAAGHWHESERQFDPFTDANDCEAVMQWLNEQGYCVTMDLNIDEHLVSIFGDDFPEPDWKGDNWRQGVCELALKVIDDE